jgi:3-oxoacyl-[acyl-carrier-protein] synthase-3
VKIDNISYCLGSKVNTISEWCVRQGASNDLRDRMQASGLHTYFDNDARTVDNLVLDSTLKLLQISNLAPSDIDLVVYFHTQQSSVASEGRDIGNLLRTCLGIQCQAFSISQQNCVSSLLSIQFMDWLFSHRKDLQRVLLVGADALGIERLRSVNGGVGMHSDGAVCALLTRDGARNQLLGSEFVSLAEHYRGMDSPIDLAASLDRQYYLVTHKVIMSALKKSGVAPADLRWILPHNVNVPGWNGIATGLKIPPERIFTKNIREKSHVYGCDGLINLADATSAHLIQPGDNFLIFSMGYGGFFGAAVFKH